MKTLTNNEGKKIKVSKSFYSECKRLWLTTNWSICAEIDGIFSIFNPKMN